MAHKSWTVGGSDGHLLQAEIATASSIGQVIALADTRLRFGLECWGSHARELAMRGSKEQAPCLVAFGRQLRHELLGLLPLAQVFQWQFGHQDRNLSFEKSVHKLWAASNNKQDERPAWSSDCFIPRLLVECLWFQQLGHGLGVRRRSNSWEGLFQITPSKSF